MQAVSPPRLSLLVRLADTGGCLLGARISLPARSLASRMQYDKLVHWEAPPHKTSNLAEWKLSITAQGSAALAAYYGTTANPSDTLSSEEIEAAVAWRSEHSGYVGLMVATTTLAFPPARRLAGDPAGWKAPNWRWLEQRRP